MPDVRVDESASPAAHRAGLITALEARRVDNRFHYVGERASRQWRGLAASHSPAQDADDGVQAYDEAAMALITALPDGRVHLIGVACGDGMKERRLLGALRTAGRAQISATPVDVSLPLVVAAGQAMGQVPGVDATQGVVVDIIAVPDLAPLLAPWLPGTRVVTLFGVISTLGPDALSAGTSLLATGDLLLVSANLLSDRPGARDDVMAQYDNVPTREWLHTVLEDVGLNEVGDIRFRWDESPAGPVIVGEVTPAHALVATVEGITVGMPAGDPIRVLQSFRQTPRTLDHLLCTAGLEVLHLAISPSGEEGVAVARAV